MTTTNTIIIGGGQAGLATSRHLTALGHDHLVIERGRVAERWRSERWDSMRLLTPNWMTRLPGLSSGTPDPDGFMRATEVAAFLADYAGMVEAPVHEHTTVRRTAHDGQGFVVDTDEGPFRSDNLVIATGWCDHPAVPPMAGSLSPTVHQVAPTQYRNPASLPDGGVLVVGASATGVQLAAELRAAGREVTLAVGRHSRAPRRYRGMDFYWWLHTIGSLDRSIDTIPDPIDVRHEPSLQLVGGPDNSTIDLVTLRAQGVRIAGRLRGIDGNHVTFDADLASTVAAADQHLAQVLSRIDRYIERAGLGSEVFDAEPTARLALTEVVESIDLRAAGITSVIWATGYRRPYPWLQLPIRDARGEIVQYRGVTPLPGAYVVGQRFQHFRNSNFIDGVGRDARFVAEYIHRNATLPDPFQFFVDQKRDRS